MVAFAAVCLLIGVPVLARQEQHRPTNQGGLRNIGVEVNAPGALVYRYLTEEALIQRWSRDPDVTVSFPRGPKTRIGKQVRVELDLPGHPWLLMEINELVDGKRIAASFVGGALTGTFAYEIRPTGNETCLVIHTMDIRGVGLIYRIAWSLIGRRLHERKMYTILSRMARLAEEEHRLSRASGPD